MTAAAREVGDTLVEWAREALRDELACSGANGVRKSEAVPTARRSVGAAGGRAESAPRVEVGYCTHRKQRGELCYKCDYKFGKPEVVE